jgi:2-polyprenyl-6-methoxyphenol hydroxylase-like FAD-dependent oxidoreductase
MALGDPEPGDGDLAVLIVRRTTLEWVLRRAVRHEPTVTFRSGCKVTGLVADPPADGHPPVVRGVRLADGTEMAATAVVASTGRRGPVPEWLAAIGVEVDEQLVHSGLMYLTRWYRLGEHTLELDPKLGGDLGFVKYLGVPGDAGTLSVTLAIRPDDRELRHALNDEARFDEACRILPGPDRFFRDGPLEPIGGVRPMTGLLNRLRRFTNGDGAPIALGFHALGDAHTCTNPLYGRGCSLAFVQAVLLADSFAEHPDDPEARSTAYEAASAREVAPWFEVSVQMDRMGADPAGLSLGSDSPDDAGSRAMAAVFTAAQTDPVLGRSLARFWNLLVTPAGLMSDGAFLTRVAEVAADPDAYPVPPREGPTREELLAALADEGAVHA